MFLNKSCMALIAFHVHVLTIPFSVESTQQNIYRFQEVSNDSYIVLSIHHKIWLDTVLKWQEGISWIWHTNGGGKSLGATWKKYADDIHWCLVKSLDSQRKIVLKYYWVRDLWPYCMIHIPIKTLYTKKEKETQFAVLNQNVTYQIKTL